MRDVSDLEGKPIVVWDAEIKAEIGKNGVTWKTYDKMGISVACAFDYRTMDYKVFMDDNLEEMADLFLTSSLIVGFNIIGFDIPLFRATLPARGQCFRDAEIYDLLFASRRATGWTEKDPFPTGMKLDDHLEATFGKAHKKTANGAEAPIFWQERRLGRLISYCLDDVKRERKLFEHVYSGLEVRTATHGARHLEYPKFLSLPI